jgi:outer membrane protein insertion porin family
MMPGRLWLAGAIGLLLWLSAVGSLAVAATDTVLGVDLVSPHQFPSHLVRAAIGDLTGRPRSRTAIRESLDRLWSLGLFSDVRVEEVVEAGGLRLRFHLVRRPFVRRLEWEGDPGLPTVDLADAAGLALGGDGSAERLDRARRNVLAAYAREGYFGAEVDMRANDDPATNGRDVTISVRPGPRSRIGAVEIRGVSEADAAALRKVLKLDPGDEYGQRTVRERVQRLEDELRKDGYFEARLRLAEPVRDFASHEIAIEVEVERGPKYRVEFHGVAELKESDLHERLGFKGSGAVDETEVATNARELEALYRESGYHFAQVTGSLGAGGEERTIRFDVSEGPRVTVAEIAVSGNQTIPAKELTEKMMTRLPGIVRSGIFRQDLLDQDLLALTAFYRTRGFLEVAVGPAEVQFSDDRHHARINIPIQEGPQLLVGQVAVEGARVRSSKDILAALPFKTGDPWVPSKATDAQRAVGRLYAQRGYLYTQVTVEATRVENRMDVTLQIQEGTPTRVGRIVIAGLIATDEEVVRREIPFKPGDPFDPELLAETEHRLSRLGLFERIQVGPLRPPQAPFADVEISLREGKPWRVEFGGGYSTSDGWRAIVEVGHDNVFGTGQSASIRQKLGQYDERTDLTYRYPWLFGTPLMGDISLFQQYHDDHIYGYKQQQKGFAAGIERTLLPVPLKDIYRLRLGLRYQLAWVRNYDVPPSLVTAGPDAILPGSQLVAKLTPAVTADYRDNVVDPRNGSFHTLSVDLAGQYLGSEASFVKSTMETKWFFEAPLGTTLALDARLGLAGPYGTSDSLPSQERFYAGGGTTIRGYPQDKVGPLDSNGNPLGGNALVIGNLEWRFPIWRWLGGAAFLDTGLVASDVGSLSVSGVKTGVGGGLRIKTPVGPLRLDVGYALNPIEGENRWQLYFGIGHAF